MLDPVKLGYKANTFSQEEKKDLSAVHFTFGHSHHDPKIFQTTAMQSFGAFDRDAYRDAQPTSLKQDPRKSNLKLTMEGSAGSHASAWVSSASREFCHKPISAATLEAERIKAKAAKKDLQQTAVVFGNASRDYHTTNRLHKPEAGKSYRPEMVVKDLRSTNWTMGSHAVDYRSEYGAACAKAPQCQSLLQRERIGHTIKLPHEQNPKSKNKNDRHGLCSVVLGNSKGKYRTHAADSFVEHPYTKDFAVEQEKVRKQKIGLQMSSIVYGKDKDDWQKSSQMYDPAAHPGITRADMCAVVVDGERLRKANFDLGNDKVFYVTEASEHMFGPGKAQQLSSARAMNDPAAAKARAKALRKSNVQMGLNKDTHVSEAQRNFVLPGKDAYDTIGYAETLGKELRRSNITFDHPDKSYSTSASDLFSKHRNEKYALDNRSRGRKENERQLRKSNFTLGNDVLDYKSVQANDFTSKKPQPGKSLQDLKSQLQKSNFNLGHDALTYERSSIGH